MFRMLKLKFIGIATLSMVMVLFLVLGLVNLITYRNAISEIFTTLEFISKNSEGFAKNDSVSYKDDDITPETQYETRYMTVYVTDEGSMITFDAEHIAAIDESELEEFIHNATDSRRTRGLFMFDGLSYAFLKTKDNTGMSKITIMDCTRNISTVQFFVKFSLYIGTLSILLLMLLLSIFARRVVQPYVKNAEAQKQFITNASHELKTPLAVISANTEVIEMMNGKSEWTESTINQVNRMSELISQLVVLSKLEERQDLVLSEVNMTAEADSVVASLKTVAETNDLKFSSSIARDVHVMADEKGIHELLNILLDNAIKYCDENGSVSVNLSKKGKSAVLVVSNDYAAGEGADYKRFFDRFYREDQSHNKEKNGYGIGLSMAESLVRMFKGKITVSYKKPVISFTVVL